MLQDCASNPQIKGSKVRNINAGEITIVFTCSCYITLISTSDATFYSFIATLYKYISSSAEYC